MTLDSRSSWEARVRLFGVVLAVLLLLWVVGGIVWPHPLTPDRVFACAEVCGSVGVRVVTAHRCLCERSP